MTPTIETKTKPMLSVSSMTMIAVMTALTCILGPMSLNIPFSPVPISLTNLVIYFSIYLLGTKKGTISYFIYLLLGLVGLPVFSGFTGGAGKLFGPTGGYIIGFLFTALICGIFIDKFPKNPFLQFAGMVLGTVVCYAFGTLWLAYVAGMNFKAALMAGVIPFIPGDLIKIVLAIGIGGILQKQLKKARVLGA